MSSLPAHDLRRRLTALAATPHLLVCTDYDGTLAPIAARPEAAQLLPGAFDLLHALARLPRTRVAIISGRSRNNLRAHSGLDSPVLLVGSHGAELPGHATRTAEHMAELDHMETALARLCAASPGAWIERKPHGLALHVREASAPDAERVMVAVRETLPRWPSVTVTEGKAVLELSLSRASKADALRWLRDGWGTRPGLVYLGDDVTDEAAFAALGTADLGIKVGGGPSLAEYRVGSEQEAVDGLAFLMSQRQGLRRP